MPVNREVVLREARMFVIQQCTVEERLEGMTPEQILESSTGEQIAGWMVLQERFREMAREPKLSLLKPNVREPLRRLHDTLALPDPHPRA